MRSPLLIVLLRAALAAGPPEVCCDGPVKSVEWPEAEGNHGLWCKQMKNSKENYMGCASLLSCERVKGDRIWLTCPDGFIGDCVSGCRTMPKHSSCAVAPEDLFEWIRSEGGFVDERLELRHGLFAKEKIEGGELLAVIPKELIISDWISPCKAIRQLREELRMGKCSKFWPYLQSFIETLPQLPDAWSLDDLALLDGLPVPEGGWRVHTQRYATDCMEDSSDALAMRALLLYHTRSGPLGMTPVFDAMNHGYNSTWHGHDLDEDGKETFWFRVITDVEPGGEIFRELASGVAYRPRIAAGMHFDEFAGAPEIFRNYGFVEKPPVMWWFDGLLTGERHAWIAQNEAGSPVWFTETEHGPGTNQPGLIMDGDELLKSLEEREQAIVETMGLRMPDITASKQHRLAWEYREAFKSALRRAMEVANESTESIRDEL